MKGHTAFRGPWTVLYSADGEPARSGPEGEEQVGARDDVVIAINEALGLSPEATDEGTRRFETGAVRSKDADDRRYDLITPIGLEAVACYYDSTEMGGADTERWVSEALSDAYSFLRGDGESFLTGAAVACLEAIQEELPYNPSHRLSLAGKSEDVPRYDLIAPGGLAAVARRYHVGIEKGYCAYNWEKGMPVDVMMNHGIAHLRHWLARDLRDESHIDDHLAAAAWNFLGAIHSVSMWPALNAGKLRSFGCIAPGAEGYCDGRHAA